VFKNYVLKLCTPYIPRRVGIKYQSHSEEYFDYTVCKFVYSMFEYISRQSVSRSVVSGRHNSGAYKMLSLLQYSVSLQSQDLNNSIEAQKTIKMDTG
jgi:hypothetical protein